MWTRALGVLLVTLAMVLAGCGDSRPTQGDVREKRINDPVRRDSVSARVGAVHLQTVRIERSGGVSAGGNSALFLSLSNTGADDRLVAVSTVDAQSVVARNGAAPPAGSVNVAVPKGDVVAMQSPYGLHLELVGLKSDLSARSFVPVTFTFARAGKVTVQVFVTRVDRQVVPSASPGDGG
jgi:copper(I)-binding protein